MSTNYEKGIVNSALGEEEITINFVETYSQSPIVKITSNTNVNIYISELTNTYLVITKSEDVEMNIHYIVIER
jgi:hypothetical protein